MAAPELRIEGLREFNRNLKALDSDLPKAVRLAFNAAADIIVDEAQARIPSDTGKARKSVKARSTRTQSRVVGGGNRAPYYPWLDFGGQIGSRSGKARGGRGRRPFLKHGRYIYNAYFRNKGEYQKVMEAELVDVAQRAGFEVD
jgi:HK97 gp10 family phage protein